MENKLVLSSESDINFKYIENVVMLQNSPNIRITNEGKFKFNDKINFEYIDIKFHINNITNIDCYIYVKTDERFHYSYDTKIGDIDIHFEYFSSPNVDQLDKAVQYIWLALNIIDENISSVSLLEVSDNLQDMISIIDKHIDHERD